MSPDGVQIADEAVRAPRLTLTPPPLNGRAQVNETGMRPCKRGEYIIGGDHGTRMVT